MLLRARKRERRIVLTLVCLFEFGFNCPGSLKRTRTDAHTDTMGKRKVERSVSCEKCVCFFSPPAATVWLRFPKEKNELTGGGKRCRARLLHADCHPRSPANTRDTQRDKTQASSVHRVGHRPSSTSHHRRTEGLDSSPTKEKRAREARPKKGNRVRS